MMTVANAVAIVVVLITSNATAMGAPASTSGEDSIDKLGTFVAVSETGSAVEGDVVVSPVPDGGVGHSVGGECHDGTNNGAGQDVVPVVELIDTEGTADQTSTEDGGVDGDELPHGRVVVGEDLELGVEVEVQEDEASESSSGVATGHRLQAVVDLIGVSSANLLGVVQLHEALLVVTLAIRLGNVRLADIEEMRTKSSDEPLDEDLEDGGGDERVEEADGGIVEIPE